jgi:hypothetical protein
MQPCFSVAWPGCFPQSVCQQDFGANRFKAVSASHTLRQLHQSVQTFGIPGSIAVGEVGKDCVSVLFDSHGKRPEHISNIGGDLIEPCEIALEGFLLGGGFIDAIKGFLEPISGFQPGEVLQPGFKDQGFAFVQVVRASKQQEPVMHQGSALFVSQAFTDVFTNSFQAGRKQLQDMELVYNQFCMRQYLVCCIVITGPHIGSNDGDPLFCGIGQVMQVTDNGWFVPISKQINDVAVVDISDHATILMQQVQFVNTQIEQLVVWKAGLDGSGELTEESADGTFYQAGFIGDADEGSSQCFLLNVGDQAIGHEMAFVHGWHWLKKGTAASTTKEPVALNGDPNALSSNGQIHEQLRFSLVAMQSVMSAMDALKRRSHQHHLEVKIMCLFIHHKNAKVRQAQEVQGHLSHCRILPKKFSFVVMFPVASEGRLLRASCCYPTYFRDVEIVCRSVKNGAIPRGIANSPFFESWETFKAAQEIKKLAEEKRIAGIVEQVREMIKDTPITLEEHPATENNTQYWTITLDELDISRHAQSADILLQYANTTKEAYRHHRAVHDEIKAIKESCPAIKIHKNGSSWHVAIEKPNLYGEWAHSTGQLLERVKAAKAKYERWQADQAIIQQEDDKWRSDSPIDDLIKTND